ncbi:MAG: NAD-dependent epimerase/dehydratase family protein [Chitinophagaceae bacterium]|nr:NAD-dependent epimerase/dehydratase family protein [Chitinophagaceae bacterium]
MKKILITGVAGLLGSHLSKYLLDKGYDVVGIDDLSGGYFEFVDERIVKNGKFYQINLGNTRKLEEIFSEYKPDYVYHFAAYAAEGLSPFIRNFNYTNNLLCSVNIINECIKNDVKKIIFTSSMAVYGEGNPPFKEDQIPSPSDPYGIAKYSVEMDLKQAYEQFGLKYSIARPHNVIGVNQNIWDRYRNVIGIWIRQILNKEPIQIYGDGTQKRAFSDIKFYMQPFESMMLSDTCDTFNIGADHEYDLNTIANLMQKIGRELGYNPEIKHTEGRHEVKDAYCDHSKAKELLNFKDDTDIESTIREMFTWAEKQPKRKIKNMNYELHKNMYSFWKEKDNKLDLPNVTLFAVACTQVDKTIYALKQSMKGIKFAEVILITHEKLSLTEHGIKVINIEKLDYKGYNHFILYKAKDYIKTDFCLLVQNDGYVLHPKKWDNRFFDYDYIGAPWRKNLHFTEDETNIRVGNGGFSFRSKKLLDMPTKLNLPFTDKGTGFFHEDGFISTYFRKELEKSGIKYAPVEIASIFSRERWCHDSKLFTFGFHNNRHNFIEFVIKKISKVLKSFIRNI